MKIAICIPWHLAADSGIHLTLQALHLAAECRYSDLSVNEIGGIKTVAPTTIIYKLILHVSLVRFKRHQVWCLKSAQ